MKAKEQPAGQELKNDESEPGKDPSVEQVPSGDPMMILKGKRKSRGENEKPSSDTGDREKKGGFANGLAVGVGIGFIATFVVMWIAVFFSPQLPAGTTYQTMLSIFIYPLVYLLAVGSITLTAGIVREYYTQRGTRTYKL
jgi:threonine/homoserine/homoserine lactone efflux protein